MSIDSFDLAPLLGRLVERLYGHRLVRNVLRGELVEQIVLDSLGAGWIAAEDYGSWDIAHHSGFRIQVKQSAALQTWHSELSGPSRPRFMIDERLGYSQQKLAVDEPRARHCEVFVFAWHPIFSKEADHRDASQWLFYVVAEPVLPKQKSIGLSGLSSLTAPIGQEALAGALAKMLG